MSKKYIVAAFALLAFACTKSPEDLSLLQEESEAVTSFMHSTVLFDEETAAGVELWLSGGPQTKAASDIIEALGAVSMERVFPDAGEFEERHRAFGLHRWYRLTYPESGAATKAGTAIVEMPGVEQFRNEPAIKLMTEYPFDDPRLPEQWHYYNDGSGQSWKAGADINVFPVWANYTVGRSDVVVGVIDSGVDATHEDLQGVVDLDNSWNFAEGGKKITAGDHGTHVGGTIAAVNNNGIGVCGIAGGDAANGIKGVTLLSCEVFGADESSGGYANAIVWAADHGAVIINNSWGYVFYNSDGSFNTEAAKQEHEFFLQPNTGDYRHSMKDAIDYFNTYAGMTGEVQTGPMAGGVAFFAAGNQGISYGSPACYPGALAVGSYTPAASRSYYSNFGDWVDIAAPGGDYNFDQILSTVPGGYATMQGTSMACPHATGVAALVVSAHGGPGFTREMLIDRLLNNSNPNINVADYKIGVPIDAMGAIAAGADETPARVVDLSAEIADGTPNEAVLSWSVTAAEDGVPAYGYVLLYGKARSAVESASASNPGQGVNSVTAQTSSLNAGSTASCVISKLDFDTAYYFKVIGYDYNLHYSEPSEIVSASTRSNNPPVISTDAETGNLILSPSETVNLLFSVTEPDGHSFSIDYERGSAADTWASLVSGGYSLRIVGGNADEGTYTATITATDEYGLSSSFKVRYTIRENHPPFIAKSLDNMIITSTGAETVIDLSEYFGDPDGESLSYTVSSSAATVVHATAASGKLHLTALGYGLSEIGVTGSDAKGESVSQSFKVLVREAGVEAQAYPNPVSTTLFIATGAEAQSTSVRIVSATGSVVYDATSIFSAFEPLSVDMSGCAPGRYRLTVKFGGKEITRNIVKK